MARFARGPDCPGWVVLVNLDGKQIFAAQISHGDSHKIILSQSSTEGNHGGLYRQQLFWPNAAMQVMTRQQIRRHDQLAIQELGIPGVVLMENAGCHAAQAVIDLLRKGRKVDPAKAHIAVVCGGGNNGGDGYVIARYLHNVGAIVTLYAAKDPKSLTGDALSHFMITQKMGIELVLVTDEAELAGTRGAWDTAHIVVDALLGTGFTGQLRPHLAAVIAACNQARKWQASIVSVDIPSGLDCDTGAGGEATVFADLTVTFVAPKIGFAQPQAKAFLGELVVAGIGTPPTLIDRVLAEKVSG